MKAYFHTFGCKVNQYETQLMKQYLSKIGCVLAKEKEIPDIIVINTCTVTQESERKCLKELRRLRKQNPDAVIVLSGCMTQMADCSLSKFSTADIIIGNQRHNRIADHITDFLQNRNRIIDVAPHDKKGEDFEGCSVNDFEGHTRAFMKIEDGCNRFCSYCVIPYARGRVRSKPISDIVNEAKQLFSIGYKEIVLVGINLSAYGENMGLSVADAVEALEIFDGLRVRLGSLEADLLNEEIIKRLGNCKNLCPQFHLSLQSGCDNTLRRMNRKYDSAAYECLVKSIYENFNNPSITTDIIVGFPGETEEDFEESLSFAKRMNFARSHIFPYSVRPGTVAERLPNQVPSQIKSERSKKMIAETSVCETEFLKSQTGKILSVLFERSIGQQTVGYSENYSEVRIDRDESVHGKIVSVIIEDVNSDKNYLIGKKHN